MSSFYTKDMTKGARALTTLSLIILNIGVGNLFVMQLFAQSSTGRNISVKDVQVAIPQAGNITQQNKVEPLTPANDKPTITTYTVAPGDTLSSIASQFTISTNTILWANDMTPKSKLKVGQKLTILPVTGIEYKVAKGDTLSSIVKKFKADTNEVVAFNELDDSHKIKVGQVLIIPDAEPVVVEKPKTKKVAAPIVETKTPVVTQPVIEPTPASVQPSTPVTQAQLAPQTTGIDTISTPVTTPETPIQKINTTGYFIVPVPGSHLSQGLHGYNSVDFGTPSGTPVLAAADGIIIVAKNSGYNGGYGKYVVISHPNGTQTMYAHLSKVQVDVEDTVKQGQVFALSGRTGRVTGPHVHFEVRGGVNPWVGDEVGTTY